MPALEADLKGVLTYQGNARQLQLWVRQLLGLVQAPRSPRLAAAFRAGAGPAQPLAAQPALGAVLPGDEELVVTTHQVY